LKTGEGAQPLQVERYRRWQTSLELVNELGVCVLTDLLRDDRYFAGLSVIVNVEVKSVPARSR
jgi:hypothetical protein